MQAITPTFQYADSGRITLTFEGSDAPFATSREAERYIEDRGFSVGRRQGSEPRGILFGDIDIQKWRNLRPIERKALHGFMAGNGRVGPIRVTIFADAPVEVRRAVVALPTVSRSSDVSTRLLGLAGDISAVVTLVFCLGAVGWVSLHPIWARPHGKIVLRAQPFSTIEARR